MQHKQEHQPLQELLFRVNGEDKAITIKDNSYTLLDKDGNEVSNTPAFAEDGTTEIGTFSIDPATGQVTFTPTGQIIHW